MSTSQVFPFYKEIQVGDEVVSYDPNARVYLVGRVETNVSYRKEENAAHQHFRKVTWLSEVTRDALSAPTRNSLGAISTLFLVPESAANEIRVMASQPASGGRSDAIVAAALASDNEGTVDDIYRNIHEQSFEFIKDAVAKLQWDEMQELVAGLLRGMGYKTRVSSPGPDQGKDIFASRDGLGFEEPRIFVEVKHLIGAVGAPLLRSFLGGRQPNDKCLYVSTGGFTKEARYEAERSRVPLTLMDLNELVRALLDVYENLDQPTQRLLPLRKLYWPMRS
jgi:restriction system protein